jgi:hypothetical protein
MKRVLVLVVVVSVFVIWVAGQSIHAASQEPSAVSGKVVETMDSGGYTYALLEKDGKKTWVACPKTKVEKGKDMSFQPGSEMVNFTSKTLNRTFDKIIFSAGPVK